MVVLLIFVSILFMSFGSSRPWLCYWILHSLALLGVPIDSEFENNVVDFLGRCQVQDFNHVWLLDFFSICIRSYDFDTG